MLHCVDVLVRIVYSRFTHIRWPATLRGLSSSAVVGFQCRVPSHCHHSIAFGHRSFPLHRQDSKYCSRSRVALTKADLAAKCSNSGCSRWVAVAGMSRLRVRVKPKLDPPPPSADFFPLSLHKFRYPSAFLCLGHFACLEAIQGVRLPGYDKTTMLTVPSVLPGLRMRGRTAAVSVWSPSATRCVCALVGTWFVFRGTSSYHAVMDD